MKVGGKLCKRAEKCGGEAKCRRELEKWRGQAFTTDKQKMSFGFKQTIISLNLVLIFG
jgi:hypothetical protein